MDIVCHALESYTARWYTAFDRKQPGGSASPTAAPTPVSTRGASRPCGCWPRRSAPPSATGSDLEARSNMMLAADVRRHGVRQFGVQSRHANAYPIAGMVKEYGPRNYPQSEPDGAARHVGVADCPRSIPFQLPKRPGSAT